MSNDEYTESSLFSKETLNYQHMIYKCLKAGIKKVDNLTDEELVLMYIFHRELFDDEARKAFLIWIGDYYYRN